MGLCFLCWYVSPGILESRVPGLLRLLFRLNALEFFEYRISYMLHMMSWSGQDSYEPNMQFERNTSKTIAGYRSRGTLVTAFADCCRRDKQRRNVAGQESHKETPEKAQCSIFPLMPKLNSKDRALLLERAKAQLYALLRNSTSCMAMKYNVDSISKLLPFITEYTANMEKRETICDRLVDSHLTKALFWALGDHKVW